MNHKKYRYNRLVKKVVDQSISGGLMIHSGGLYVSGWKSQKPIVALEVQEAQNQSVLAGNRYLRNSQWQ
jgi:hypothetical protein